MAKVLILGGGFAGVVAAESLAKKLGHEHQISLVSRSSDFVFYPALVRLAFGHENTSDVSFDLREAMLDRRVTFVEGEVARVNTSERIVKIARGDFAGEMPYDFLVFALGRRLATERIHGFFEHAHHLLTVESTLKFRNAIENFAQGHIVIGQCPGARLPVPLFEAAFSLFQSLERRSNHRTAITLVSNETPEEMFQDAEVGRTLRDAMDSRAIELVFDFDIVEVTARSVVSADARAIDCDMTMIIPPFAGPSPVVHAAITDIEGYVRVDETMRVTDVENMYAAGDCVSLPGPKMGHMAVRQAEVAAENLANQINGRAASATYDHELLSVIDAGGADTIFLRKDLTTEAPAAIKQGRFWAWAKRGQEEYWLRRHA